MKLTPGQIAERIFNAYASDSGSLFGIPRIYRGQIEMIVKAALEIYERDTS